MKNDNSYWINKLRVQQFGLTATIKDDDGKEHHFYRGHEYVEIGGVKWAVTNVGAEKETDSGLYFAFGEKQGYTAEQVRSGERKFNENGYTNVNFDSVNAYWGGKWRLPTDTEFQALISSTTSGWIENYQGSGVNGMLFTDKTDWSKKLFFPTVGYCSSGIVCHETFVGSYWSRSLFANNVNHGIYLYLDKWSAMISYNVNFLGFPIRGVVGE